jgi:hypothetical protein
MAQRNGSGNGKTKTPYRQVGKRALDTGLLLSETNNLRSAALQSGSRSSTNSAALEEGPDCTGQRRS